MYSEGMRGKQTEQGRRVIRVRDSGAKKGDDRCEHESKSEERKR